MEIPILKNFIIPNNWICSNISHFPHFRAIDIQDLIGNVGGYIGLFLGYSFLQIPEFLILVYLRAKRCCAKIRERRDQNQTRTLNIRVHENNSSLQGRWENESNEDCAGNDRIGDKNVHPKELIARVEQLEHSTQYIFRSLEKNRKIQYEMILQ